MELLTGRSLIVLVLLAETGWFHHLTVSAAPQRDIKFRIECHPEKDISLAAPAPSLLSGKPEPIVKQKASETNDVLDQESEQSAPQSQVEAAPDDKVAETPDNADGARLPKIPKLKLPLTDALMEKIKSTDLQSIKKPNLLKMKSTQPEVKTKSIDNKVEIPSEKVDVEDETVKQPTPEVNKGLKSKLPKLSEILKSKQNKDNIEDTPNPKETLLAKIAKLKKTKEPEIVEQSNPVIETDSVTPDSKPSKIKLKSKLLKSSKIDDSPKEQLVQESAPAPKYSKLEKLLQLKKTATPEKVASSGDDYVISPLKKTGPLRSSQLKSPNLSDPKPKSSKIDVSPKEQLAQESAPAPKYSKLQKLLQSKKTARLEKIASGSQLKSPQLSDSKPESPLKPLNLDKLSSALERLRSTASDLLEKGNSEKFDPSKLSRLSKPLDFESLRPKKLNLGNDFLQSERYSPKVPRLRSKLPDPPVRKPSLRKPYEGQYLAAEQTDYSPTAMSLCECIKKAFPKGVKDGSFVLSDDGDLAPSADSLHPVYAAAPAKMLRDARLADEGSKAEKYSKIKNGVQKMIHFVDILGQVDQYISDRTKIIVNKLSKLYEQYK